MIKLERIRTAAAIINAFRGATPRTRLIATMKKVRAQIVGGATLATVKLEFESKWADTKTQLLIESHDKCSYCESSMLAVAFGDVEHYRPKSKYWWLAYVYDNYLASCAICNQRFKSDLFAQAGVPLPPPAVLAQSSDPELEALAATAIPDPLDAVAVAAFEAAHRAEKPLIPNPYFDDPEEIFDWDVLEGAGEVEVVPKPGNQEAPNIVEACERIYGINRPDLKRRRFQRYQFYNGFVRALQDLPADAPSRPLVESLVLSMKNSDSEYAGMIRYLEAQRLGN